MRITRVFATSYVGFDNVNYGREPASVQFNLSRTFETQVAKTLSNYMIGLEGLFKRKAVSWKAGRDSLRAGPPSSEESIVLA